MMNALLLRPNVRRLSERLFFSRQFAYPQAIKSSPRCNFSILNCRMSAKKRNNAHKNWKNSSKSPILEKSTLPVPSTNPSAYQSFAQVLGLRQSSTLLYQAESHTGFIVSCYLVGGFCFTWAGINFRNQYLYPLQGTPPVLSTIMGGVCLGMVALGCWFMIRPSRIVQTINALPATTNPRSNSLLLQVEKAALLPGKQPYSLIVAAEDVTLSSAIFQSESKRSELERAEIKRRQDQMNELNRSRIMTAPFRQFSYLTWRMFIGAKSFLSTEGFIYMRVNGKNGVWKIDRSAAWALESGKALDRLVKHNL